MGSIYLEVLGALVRWALTVAGGYLVAHHVLTADQTDRFSTDVLAHLVLWAPVIAALAWSVWQKFRQRLKVSIALDLKPGSTPSDVQHEMKHTTLGETLRGTLPLVVALVVGAAAATGCTSHLPPNLTPAASIAWHQTQVQKPLDLLRDMAIDANAQQPPLVSETATRAIVTWHRAAIVTVRAAGSGWQAAVRTGLDQALTGLSPGERATLQPYVQMVQAILSEVLQ